MDMKTGWEVCSEGCGCCGLVVLWVVVCVWREMYRLVLKPAVFLCHDPLPHHTVPRGPHSIDRVDRTTCSSIRLKDVVIVKSDLGNVGSCGMRVWLE
jgi:hypothetical protein